MLSSYYLDSFSLEFFNDWNWNFLGTSCWPHQPHYLHFWATWRIVQQRPWQNLGLQALTWLCHWQQIWSICGYFSPGHMKFLLFIWEPKKILLIKKLSQKQGWILESFMAFATLSTTSLWEPTYSSFTKWRLFRQDTFCDKMFVCLYGDYQVFHMISLNICTISDSLLRTSE